MTSTTRTLTMAALLGLALVGTASTARADDYRERLRDARRDYDRQVQRAQREYREDLRDANRQAYRRGYAYPGAVVPYGVAPTYVAPGYGDSYSYPSTTTYFYSTPTYIGGYRYASPYRYRRGGLTIGGPFRGLSIFW